MILNSLDSLKNPNDFTEQSKCRRRVTMMMDAVCACACVIEKDSTIKSRTRGVNWKEIATFPRHQQYHPTFLSRVKDQINFTDTTLTEIVLSGEFDRLHKMCRLLKNEATHTQDTLLLPNFSRLNGFYQDQYLAQHIESSVTNWFTYRKNYARDDRARILRHIMIIGEAFNTASPFLLSKYDPAIVERFINARNFLCHPERPANRDSIHNFVENNNPLSIDGQDFTIEELDKNITAMTGIAEKHLDNNYDLDRDLTPQHIFTYGSDGVWNQNAVQIQVAPAVPLQDYRAIFAKYKIAYDKSKSENEKYELRKSMRNAITERRSQLKAIPLSHLKDMEINEIKNIDDRLIEENRIDQTFNLQETFKVWVDANDPHSDENTKKHKAKQKKLRAKLTTPAEEIGKMKQSLDKDKDKYESAKIQQENGDKLSEEDSKLMQDYSSVKLKHERWSEYADEKLLIEERAKTLQEYAETERITKLSTKTLLLLRFTLLHAEHAERNFKLLNDITWVSRTAGRHVSRGFSSHQDHPILEFDQVMVGSCARALLENNMFKEKAPKELLDIMTNHSKRSRGYLAHIGVRQVGETADKAQHTSEVFETNSLKLRAAIPMLRAVVTALENNSKYVPPAQQQAVLCR